MADNIKISQLTEASAVAGVDVFPVVSGGNTKKVKFSTLIGEFEGILYPSNNIKFNLICDEKCVICKISNIEEVNFLKCDHGIDTFSDGDKEHFCLNGGLKNPYNKFSDGTTIGTASGNTGNTGTGFAYLKNGILEYLESYNETPTDADSWVVSSYPPIKLKGTMYDFNAITEEIVSGLNDYVAEYIVNGFHNRLIIAQRTASSPVEFFIFFGNHITSVGADYALLNTIFTNYYTVINLDGGGSIQCAYNGLDIISNQNLEDSNRAVPTAFKLK